MKKSVLLATAVAAVLVVSLLTATGYAAAGKRDGAAAGSRTEKGAATKAETYTVVQIGEDIKVVRKSEMANLKKTTAEDYKRDMKAYQDAKKDSVKNKEKSELLKPVKHTVTTLKDFFKTEQEANDWKDSYLEKKKDDPKTAKNKKTDAW